MTFQHERQPRPDGGYNLVSWDDAVGHAVIWEYDADDRLRRRGVITHHDPGGTARSGEVVWHDANGNELERRPLRSSDDTAAG